MSRKSYPMGAEPVVDIFVAGTMENRQIVPPSSLPAIGAEALAAKAMNEAVRDGTRKTSIPTRSRLFHGKRRAADLGHETRAHLQSGPPPLASLDMLPPSSGQSRC